MSDESRGVYGHSALHVLAERMGIVMEYTPVGTHEPIFTTDETCVALLAAMGIDASSEELALAAFAELDAARESRWLPSAWVMVGGHEAPTSMTVAVPASEGAEVSWWLELREEDGRSRAGEGRARVGHGGRIEITLGAEPLPLGYHDLALRVGDGDREHAGTQRLIVVPPRCASVAERLGNERVWGITANLYSVTSARDWGAGDCTDLCSLVEWGASRGAAFIGVNPLHALRNRGHDVSPYSPVSRLFRNVLYIDVEAVPELAECDEARGSIASDAFAREHARLRALPHVDYEGVMALKRPLLERLHAEFARRHRGTGDARDLAYEAFLAMHDGALTDFATFCALEEAALRGAPPFDAMDGAPGWWREWPAPYRDARSDAVARFREENAEQVDLHRWMQFELDRQLARVGEHARAAGMRIGVYQDLAIGSAANGSEPWRLSGLFARGVSIGAPPDPLGPQGQNWGLPPIVPHRLAADGYRYWSSLVRAALRHAGALRIDHVMGLFRQFWIPEGKSGREGAYVRFPAEPLLGILALESVRAGAIIVGEDLGTVPPEVPPLLERWGILSSKVLYFERDGDRFRPPRSYPRLALATVNTHDLASLAAFWQGDDLVLRRELGLIVDEAHAEHERRRRQIDRGALLALLATEGLIPDLTADVSDVQLRAAVHALIRRTPSWLVGLALDDITGERDPVNVPGLGPDTFRSWIRRMRTSLESLAAMPAVERVLGVERAR